MFFLSEIEHTMRLPPHLLNLPLDKAIKGELDSLFLDKVMENLGLCVSVYDIQSIEGGFVLPGDGAFTYTVKFRLVMFRPFEGEVIAARVKESTKDGLRLSLGFFDDIYIPVPLLPFPNRAEPDPGHKNGVLWSWEYEGDSFPLHVEDEIRFSVHNVSYPALPPDQSEASDVKANANENEKEKESKQKDLKPFAPMVVMGAIDLDGLGPLSWWV